MIYGFIHRYYLGKYVGSSPLLYPFLGLKSTALETRSLRLLPSGRTELEKEVSQEKGDGGWGWRQTSLFLPGQAP